MQYYIGSAKFIGLEISSNIGYRNIGKMSSVQHCIYISASQIKVAILISVIILENIYCVS